MEWIRILRFPICAMAGLLAVMSFRLGGMSINWLAVVAVFFGACTAMLQNDWRDRYRGSRKGKWLALQYPLEFRILLSVYWVVTSLLIFSLVFSPEIREVKMGLLLAAMAVASLLYSEARRVPLLPGILVALTWSAPALLPIVAGTATGADNNWAIFLAVAFLSFGREIITDLKDQKIDSGYKWTIPVAVGEEWAKVIAAAFIAAGIIMGSKVSLAILVVAGMAMICVVIKIREGRILTSEIAYFFDAGVMLTALVALAVRIFY